MFDLKTLKKIDKKSMYQAYDSWAEISKESYNSNIKITEFRDIDHIVFIGMGGSGTIGDIFSSILSKTNIHVSIVKGYLLPKTVDKKSLLIFTSVSGNTIETLSALKNAKKQGFKTISFSSGGLLEKYCEKNNLEYKKIKENHSPRASFVSYLYSILKILEDMFPIKKKEIINSIKELEKLNKKISSKNLTSKNPAIKLAKEISGIPLIYYPSGLQAVAIRFKNSLQENAKMHTFVEDVVESSHNGIVAWEKKSQVSPILLQGYDDYIKTKERWKIIKTYFDNKEISYAEVFSIKGDILSKIIHLVYLLDYTSIYKAVLSNIDPSPVKSIDFIKSNLD
ncbi:MAG: SIS domain-containing protein [Candidatus Nitrosopumilus sp. bin_68KS]